jgi:hypothetical protein
VSELIAWDKKGIPIQVGDLLKVDHFKCGRRNVFMYHVAQKEFTAPHDGSRYLRVRAWDVTDSHHMIRGEQRLIEVIDGNTHRDNNGVLRCFWERKKVKAGFCPVVECDCGSRGPSDEHVCNPHIPTEAEAWQAWDAMNRGEWLDKPTEPGWWWWRVNEFRTTMKYVTNIDDHRISPGYRWQGQIKPKE